jgi:hypothetical protein
MTKKVVGMLHVFVHHFQILALTVMMLLEHDTRLLMTSWHDENISEVLRKFEIKVGDLKMYLSVRILLKQAGIKHCS